MIKGDVVQGKQNKPDTVGSGVAQAPRRALRRTSAEGGVIMPCNVGKHLFTCGERERNQGDRVGTEG